MSTAFPVIIFVLAPLKLSLEFATLSKHTGNQTYNDLASKSVTHIAGLVSLKYYAFSRPADLKPLFYLAGPTAR